MPGAVARRYAALAAFVVVAVGATPSAAEQPGAVGLASPFDSDIRFEVAGVISPRCSVDQSARSASFGQLVDPVAGGNRAAAIDLDLNFACNSPFRVVMTSDNGGLQTSARGGANFRDRISYSAVMSWDAGRRRTPACESHRMVRGADRCVFRTNGGAAGPATVKLAMDADATPLLAGAYSDRLVLRITPLLGGDSD